MTTDKTRLMTWYYEMCRLRYFEETCKSLYQRNLILGSIHLSIGQEAIAVGTCSALRKTDMAFVTFRGHGHCLAKGADSRRLMAEILKKRDGCCRGKGGSLHLCDTSVGVMEGNGIVGAGIPHAVGAALAFRHKQSDQVAVAVFGDGATNQGAFHEAANLAAIWNLPVIFVCENNQYSEMTPIKEMIGVKNPLADRAGSYAIPSAIVDGNDPEAVSAAMHTAVSRARRGEGPTFLEAITYRLEGHMYGDTGGYRSDDEVAEAHKNEPIERLRQRLLALGVQSTDLDERARLAEEEMKSAAEFAIASPEPEAMDAFEDVYA